MPTLRYTISVSRVWRWYHLLVVFLLFRQWCCCLNRCPILFPQLEGPSVTHLFIAIAMVADLIRVLACHSFGLHFPASLSAALL